MPLPRISPLELGRTREPFDHPDALYELKQDDWRALLYLENRRAVEGARLLPENVRPVASRLPC